jgi:hypothetical protein
MTLTPRVGSAGSANPAQATMAGAGQGEGWQTQVEPPPGPSQQQAQHPDLCLRTDCRLLSRIRAAQRKIGTFTTILLNCKFAENEPLSPPPVQETERRDGQRTSG